MSLLPRWLRRGPALAPAQCEQLDRYCRLAAVDRATNLDAVRFVVVDVETSGLNPYHDRLIAVGAVTVVERLLRLDDSFEIVLRQAAPSTIENILVHGIDGTTQQSGIEPGQGLLDFLGYAGKQPLVGFHAGFDRVVIARACRDVLGVEPANPWLDLAYLAPALLRTRAPEARNLDDWTAAFGLENPARHHAVADAFATAQLFQIVLAEARRQQLATCADLMRLEKNQRWLYQG